MPLSYRSGWSQRRQGISRLLLFGQLTCKRERMAYQRVLLKLSGEALMGEQGYGIDPAIVNAIAKDVAEAVSYTHLTLPTNREV